MRLIKRGEIRSLGNTLRETHFYGDKNFVFFDKSEVKEFDGMIAYIYLYTNSRGWCYYKHNVREIRQFMGYFADRKYFKIKERKRLEVTVR